MFDKNNWPNAPCKGKGSCVAAQWASCDPGKPSSALSKESGNVRIMALDTSDPAGDVGRLEIKIDGRWGTVFKDGFDNKEADVACAQLGYQGGGLFDGTASESFAVKDLQSLVIAKNIQCKGTEKDITTCNAVKNTNGDNSNLLCKHSSDVKIKCANKRCEFKV